jgi:hypothetical protein
MAFTGGEQGKLTRIPALGFFGACSGLRQSTHSGFSGIRCKLSFTAPGKVRAGEIDNIMGFGAS